jgi:hypothetical protein
VRQHSAPIIQPGDNYMTKRRITKIDGGSILADTGSSIRDALDLAGISNVPQVVSGGEIITQSDFNRTAPAHDMLINLIPIEKGASLRERLLDRECELIATTFRESTTNILLKASPV